MHTYTNAYETITIKTQNTSILGTPKTVIFKTKFKIYFARGVLTGEQAGTSEVNLVMLAQNACMRRTNRTHLGGGYLS